MRKKAGCGLRAAAVLAVLAGVCAAPSAASAQSAAPEARSFVGVLAGVTFGTESGAMIAGRYGHRVGRNLHVFGEVGRITDVTPSEIADQFDELVDLIGEDVPVSFSATVPATTFVGGIRWSQARGKLSPFVEAGAGGAHLRADIDVRIAGIDVSDEIREELGEELTTTKFLLLFGGGVNVAVSSSLSVDAGYRFTRIFTDAPAVNCSAVYAAVVWRVR